MDRVATLFIAVVIYTATLAGLQKVELELEEESEDDEQEEVDGMTLNKDSVAVDPDSGVPIATKSMTVEDLRTELGAKGFSQEGNKTELARRTNVSLSLLLLHKARCIRGRMRSPHLSSDANKECVKPMKLVLSF